MKHRGRCTTQHRANRRFLNPVELEGRRNKTGIGQCVELNLRSGVNGNHDRLLVGTEPPGIGHQADRIGFFVSGAWKFVQVFIDLSDSRCVICIKSRRAQVIPVDLEVW